MTPEQVTEAVGPDHRIFCVSLAKHGMDVVMMLTQIPVELYEKAAELHRQDSLTAMSPKAATHYTGMAKVMDCLASFTKQLTEINNAAIVQATALDGKGNSIN